MHRELLLCWAAALLLALRGWAVAETVKLPMKDGVKLATDVHLPSTNGTFPVIFLRTPYNRAMGIGLGAEANKRGMAMVVQDTRGRFGSEGANLAFDADAWGEHQDGLETIGWIKNQPWCNGKIGTFGGSALSITTFLLAGTGTGDLTCQHFTVGTPNLYEGGIYMGGVFRKALAEDWLRQSKFSDDALKLWTSHPTYDSYWKQRDLTERYGKINAPAVHVGGWYDIFAQGTIDAFMGYQYRGGPGARGRQKLVMGPWTHGVMQEKAGELKFSGGNKPPTRVTDSWAWFEYWLKGTTNGMAEQSAVTYYVMGDAFDPQAPGNVWRTAAMWPPESETVSFYFGENRELSRAKPASESKLTFTYDPKNPAPTVGGPQLTLPAGPREQSKVEERPDVLVFTGEALGEPLEVTGKVKVKLWVSSDARDTDFLAKLCDVYPDGRSFNICEGALRARFREGLEKEKFLEPGNVYPIEIDLWSTSIIFNKGHKLRVQVTSSSDRGYDPNPNTGEKFRANDKTVIAKNTVHMGAERASAILLPMPRGR